MKMQIQSNRLNQNVEQCVLACTIRNLNLFIIHGIFIIFSFQSLNQLQCKANYNLLSFPLSNRFCVRDQKYREIEKEKKTKHIILKISGLNKNKIQR